MQDLMPGDFQYDTFPGPGAELSIYKIFQAVSPKGLRFEYLAARLSVNDEFVKSRIH